MNLFVDRKFRLPRIWSNRELERFAPLFAGDVLNVSAWRDLDKEGRRYRDYFTNASSYTITNYKAEVDRLQGYEDEIFLDLEQPLPAGLVERFDVVFNHTVLEHVYDVQTAFGNLCRLTKDVVILVVPFLQQMHAAYADYWRFSPLAIKRLFEDNEMELLYLSFNEQKKASVYVFAIASKMPSKWRDKFEGGLSFRAKEKPRDGSRPYVACHAIGNGGFALARRLRKVLGGMSLKKHVGEETRWSGRKPSSLSRDGRGWG